MKNESKNIYTCDLCNKATSQVYSFNVEGKYKALCVKCAFKKK